MSDQNAVAIFSFCSLPGGSARFVGYRYILSTLGLKRLLTAAPSRYSSLDDRVHS